MSLEKNGPTRRNFLKGAVVTAGIAGLGAAALRNLQHNNEKEKREDAERAAAFAFLNVDPHPRLYATGHLAGHKHMARMTGLHPTHPVDAKRHSKDARIPAKASVDFSFVLANMWKEKVALMGRKSDTYRGAIHELFTTYNPETAEKTDLGNFRSRIASEIDVARSEVPLDRVTHLSAFKDFAPVQVDLLKALERRILPTSLLACSMTELMPTSGAEAAIGVQEYDWLLRNAGLPYIEDGVPALGDREFSFGPYQFIPGALRNAHTGKPEGATLIEALAPPSARRLPQELGELRGRNEHRAAYLLAVHNLALLVRRLNEQRSAALLELLPHMPADLVPEFVAASHHVPERAINVIENDYLPGYQSWRKDAKKIRKPDFVECCAPEGDLGTYAGKTRDNLHALRTYFSAAQKAE